MSGRNLTIPVLATLLTLMSACTVQLDESNPVESLAAILLGDANRRDLILLSTSSATTSETGTNALVEVSLKRAPTATVTLNISSSDSSEGLTSASSLSFTPSDWDSPQLVYVYGQDDTLADGNQTYQLLASPGSSDDPAFAGADTASLNLSNSDNDSPGLTVSGNNILVHENATIHASLPTLLREFAIRPTNPASPGSTITIQISSGSQSGCEPTPTTSTIVFTDADISGSLYNYKAVAVQASPDTNPDASATRTCSLAFQITSDDSGYNGLSVAEKTASVVDDDNAWIQIVSDDAHQYLTENGRTRTARIMISRAPVSNVTVCLQSSSITEATILNLLDASIASGACLTAGATHQVVFTNADWNTPKLVRLQGQNDVLRDGNQIVNLVSPDVDTVEASYVSNYPGVSGPAALTFTNLDNDRYIFTTNTANNGNLGGGFIDDGNGGIVAGSGPDGICNADGAKPNANNYYALISDGNLRTASPANNWVLLPRNAGIDANSYEYRDIAGILVMQTNAAGLAPFNWSSIVNATGNAHWTGLNTDWSAATNNCSGWTDGTTGNGTAGFAGQINSSVLGGNLAISCAGTYRLLCVEQ